VFGRYGELFNILKFCFAEVSPQTSLWELANEQLRKTAEQLCVSLTQGNIECLLRHIGRAATTGNRSSWKKV